MTDTHSKTVRSYNMSRIRSKNTKPELAVRKYLFAHGFRYRLQDKKLPGKPDIIMPKYKTVIFVHGCFWHAHENCRYAVMPKSNTEYWTNKIYGNLARDHSASLKLHELGWKQIILWECDLRKLNFESAMLKLIKQLQSDN
jgi:DNA mismatch endonuclease, patch repair protein